MWEGLYLIKVLRLNEATMIIDSYLIPYFDIID